MRFGVLLGVAIAPFLARGAPAATLRAAGEIVAPGVPGPLCVFGKDAFVVAVGGSGKLSAPVVAAGTLGRGRVVAFGHGGYFGAGALEDEPTAVMVAATLAWAGGASGGIYHFRVPAIGTAVANGPEPRAWNGDSVPADCRVLVLDAGALRDERRFAEVESFVRKGGGLMVTSLGWGWKQLNPGKDLRTEHEGNRLLALAGIVWADGYLKRTGAKGFIQPRTFDLELHADAALRGRAATSQAVATLTTAVHAIPVDDRLFRPRLGRAVREVAYEQLRTVKQSDGLARVAFAWSIDEAQRLAADRVRAHPWSQRFPGSVPSDAKRVDRAVSIDTRVPRWHSTGLYAPAGEMITVRGGAQGMAVRIGAHSDRVWDKPEWERAPEVSRRWLLEGTTRVASAFGGHIYIEVPQRAKAQVLDITIEGAVDAPWFVLGKTTPAEWKRIRERPAPWAELGTDKLIVTLPSRAIRELDDPTPVLEFWNEVMDACADLRGIPRERASPERIVCDRQISVGYMHAGYPIMCHLDQEGWLANVERLRKGNWGLFHEIGHNHQHPDWTFGGTTEVTVNLFTLYVLDTVCKVERPRANQYGEARAKRIKEYVEGGRKFGEWKSKPFLALLMYQQMQEEFGWDAYKAVFRGYEGAPRPKNDAEKRDFWMIRFSRHVGKNLAPFFESWGVPTSEQARRSLADLPPWP